jgi:NhaP-type Na+/H+ or K+/H+ antiporter
MKSLLGLFSLIPFAGVIGQWLAWRLRFPSILILLLTGFVLGPVTGILSPDMLLGDALFPIVSLSVGIILFEGGLSLKISDLSNTRNVVRNLITVGAVVTWVSIALPAHYFLGLTWPLSILTGAILVVTGPTVIIPLLKHIRLKKELSSVLRWEGITIDPVGATLAVLIFDVMIAQSNDTVLGQVLLGIGLTLFLGVAFGILGAIILIVIIRRHLVPEYLQEAFTLIIVIGMYGLSDMIQGESGLLVVTIMGIILANQRIVTIKHIITFKEQLTVLLLSSVFVLLAARINISELTVFFNKEMLMFLLVLFFVSRPLTVFVSTLGSSLSIKERLFMSCMAPRGIVAAAVASLFSIKLVESGYEGAEVIQSIVFMVIIVTVTVYGLLGQPLAVFLGLKPAQKGIVIVGAHPWGRNIAKVLVSLNIDILLVDTKKENVIAAKEEQLKVIHGSILSKKVMEEIEFGIYGHLMAISKSDEINLLSNLEYAELFGRSETFRLRPKDRRRDLMIGSSSNFLFGNNATYPFISTRITAGAKVHSTIITKDFSYDFFLSSYPKAIPLFLVNTKNQLKIITKNTKIKTEEGEILVSII